MRRSHFEGTPKQQGRLRRKQRRSVLPTGFQYDQDDPNDVSTLKVKRAADGTDFVMVSAGELAGFQSDSVALVSANAEIARLRSTQADLEDRVREIPTLRQRALDLENAVIDIQNVLP